MPDLFGPSGSQVFFRVRGASSAFDQVWRSDGTAAGTLLLLDQRVTAIYPFGTGALLSSGSYGDGTWELWKSNGTVAGSTMVTDLNPSSSSAPVPFARSARPSSSGHAERKRAGALPHGWHCRGDEPGVFELVLGLLPGDVPERQGAWGDALWVSDGTAAGTYSVKSGFVSTNSTDRPPVMPRHALGSGIVFFALDSLSTACAVRPWFSDGTTAGTTALGTVCANDFANAIASGVQAGAVYFNGARELWRTDGTAAGTSRVATAAAGGNSPKTFRSAGARLFYVARYGDTATAYGFRGALRDGWDEREYGSYRRPTWNRAPHGPLAVERRRRHVRELR